MTTQTEARGFLNGYQTALADVVARFENGDAADALAWIARHAIDTDVASSANALLNTALNERNLPA